MVDVFDGRKSGFFLTAVGLRAVLMPRIFFTVETMESLQFEYQLGGLPSMIAEVIHWVCQHTQVSFGESAKSFKQNP